MAVVYDCQIIGAGAAGISLMIALENQIASASGVDKEKLLSLQNSCVILEGQAQGGGQLGHYRINANADAAEMVSGIADNTAFSSIRDAYLKSIDPEQPLISPTQVNTSMLQPLADKVRELLVEHLRFNSPVAYIRKDAYGFHSFNQGDELLASSQHVVIACGGSEPLLDEPRAFEHKSIVASDFLQLDDPAKLSQRDGNIVIVGASHSGFSCAWRLLNDPLRANFCRGRQIQICHQEG